MRLLTFAGLPGDNEIAGVSFNQCASCALHNLDFLEGGILIGRLKIRALGNDAEVHVSNAVFGVCTVKNCLPTGPKDLGKVGARGCEKTVEDLW